MKAAREYFPASINSESQRQSARVIFPSQSIHTHIILFIKLYISSQLRIINKINISPTSSRSLHDSHRSISQSECIATMPIYHSMRRAHRGKEKPIGNFKVLFVSHRLLHRFASVHEVVRASCHMTHAACAARGRTIYNMRQQPPRAEAGRSTVAAHFDKVHTRDASFLPN